MNITPYDYRGFMLVLSGATGKVMIHGADRPNGDSGEYHCMVHGLEAAQKWVDEKIASEGEK